MKNLAVIIMMIVFSTMGFSQVSVGAKIGTNKIVTGGFFTNFLFSSDSYSNYEFEKGLVIDYPLNERWSINSGFDFTRRTYAYSTSILFFTMSQNSYSFNTVEVPVLFRYTGKGKLKFYANIGPYFNYTLGGTIYKSDVDGVAKFGNIIFEKEPFKYTGTDYYVKDKMRRLDFGMYFGGGVRWDFDRSSVFLDMRYGVGFADINLDPNDKITARENNLNRSLTIGYMYTLGKEK